MKRLRDIEAPSPLIEKAQALIETVDPLPTSHERMLRVRQRLDQPRGMMAGVLASVRRLPALALATLVVMFGASAFAAVRIYVAVVAPAVAPAPAVPESTTRTPRKARRPVQRKLPSPDPAQAVENAAAEEALPEIEPAHRSTRNEPRAHGKPQPKPSTREAVPNDSALVHRAVKALRRDGNPALAAQLLDENRARNPNGPLAEEALSLQIEAARALGEARTIRLAREYMARFPNGRYRDVARAALEDSAP